MDNNNQSEVNEVKEPQESYGGWIKLYRQITESKIWETKPSSWVVCWIYILLKVSFVNNNSYKKGEAHFRGVEYEALPFDITNDIWYRCLKWLEEEGMIKRRKVWRGEVITVLNYEKYQNNLSSENCKTEFDPNHIKNIQTNIDKAEAVQHSETPKSYPNHIQIETQTNIDEMQAQDTLKNIRIKELKNNNIIVSKDTMEGEVLNPSLTEKEKDKNTSIAAGGGQEPKPKKAKKTGKVSGTEIFKLVKTFYEIMGFVWNDDDAMGKNSRAASSLLSMYTYDDIVKAVKIGIEEYKKEKKDPKHMIPTLESVKKLIHVWLSKEQEKQQKQEARNYGW